MKLARIEAALCVMLEFAEAFNGHDVAGMVQRLTDDWVLETAGPNLMLSRPARGQRPPIH